MKIFRLKELLDQKGITGKILAKGIGITEASVSNLVKGESIPKKSTLVRLARFLDVDVRDLFVSTNSNPFNGFIEYKGVTYSVKTKEDLKILLNKVEKGS